MLITVVDRREFFEVDDSTSLHIINVRVRPTNTTCRMETSCKVLIGDFIVAVCQKAGLNAPSDHYYLIFEGHELNVNDTIRDAGLLNITNVANENYPELRLKFLYQLGGSPHFATHVVLTSPEELVYREVFEIPHSPTKQDIMPDILKSLVKQTRKHKLHSSTFSSKLISMPVFTKQAINELPSVHITIPLKPNEFDWNEFLQYLAMDLDIDKNDMFLMSVQEGSTKYEIKFKAAISLSPQKMKKINEKIGLIVLPTSNSTAFIAQQKLSGDIQEIPKIEAKLSNFSKNQIPLAPENLTNDDIDAALGLMQRPAIIDSHVWEYLREKSRKISSAILHAFQRSKTEYVIESMLLVQNEELYDKYVKCAVHGEEKVLFHGTKSANFDGIFDTNFKNLHTTDKGWYGQGIYFSSSPEYCATYAKPAGSGIMYLICSLVKLGNVYLVKDKSYGGKPMHDNSDTHYVKVDADGYPTNAENSFFEEFVIKKSDQILPLYIVGLRKVHRFVLWRDAKIANSENGALFGQMKERYNFNIYGSETSVDGLATLKCKLDDPKMQCVIATNGGDEGEYFVRECRNVRSSVPIIVYCMNVDYHRQWAAVVSSGSTSQIQVTSNSSDVFHFISTMFSNESKPNSVSAPQSLTPSNSDDIVVQPESSKAVFKIQNNLQVDLITSMRKTVEMQLVKIESQAKELAELNKFTNRLIENAKKTDLIIQEQKQQIQQTQRQEIQKQHELITLLQKTIEDQKAQTKVWLQTLQQMQQPSITKPINTFDTAPSDTQHRLRNPPEGIRTIDTPTPDSPSSNAPELEPGNPALFNFPQKNGKFVRPGQPLPCAAIGPSQNVTFAVIGHQGGQGVIEPVVPNPLDTTSYGIYQVTIFDEAQLERLISTLITVVPERKICVPKQFVIRDSVNNIVVGGRVTLKRTNRTIAFTGVTDSTGNVYIRRENAVCV